MKPIIAILMFLFMFLSAICLSVSYIAEHESAHVAIYRNYGCIDASWEYTSLMKAVTKCHEWSPSANKEKAKEFNSLNEIIGYNVSNISFSIIVASIIIATAIMFKGE